MTKKKFINLIIIWSFIIFLACSSNEKENAGIKGYVKDELGNPLTDVSISYRNPLITVETNSEGGFKINTTITLFLEFKKEGYYPLITKINNFSDDATYNFNTITLKKTSNADASYKDISLNTDSKFKHLNVFGNVLNIFGEPLKKTTITLTESLIETYSLTKLRNSDGYFEFTKNVNQIAIKKEGFKDVILDLPVYEKDSLKITLLKKLNKKGIYLLKSGKYIPLPQIKLTKNSKQETGHILWGGNFSYDITDFFYPNKAKEFKIEKDSILRFIIFETQFNNYLFRAKNEDGYLCTANYKISTSPFPSAGNTINPTNEVYPSKYSTNHSDEPTIRDFKLINKNLHYVFVNTENKKGYYFTY